MYSIHSIPTLSLESLFVSLVVYVDVDLVTTVVTLCKCILGIYIYKYICKYIKYISIL